MTGPKKDADDIIEIVEFVPDWGYVVIALILGSVITAAALYLYFGTTDAPTDSN